MVVSASPIVLKNAIITYRKNYFNKLMYKESKYYAAKRNYY